MLGRELGGPCWRRWPGDRRQRGRAWSRALEPLSAIGQRRRRSRTRAIAERNDFSPDRLAVSVGYSSDAVIGEQLGNYRLVRPPIEGGMGLVYLAEHAHLRRRAA
jgi:hypothetical protein